jgi:hypothetical protein
MSVRLNEVKYKADTYKQYDNTPEVRKAVDAARSEFANYKPGMDYVNEMTKWCDGLEIAADTAEFEGELNNVREYLAKITSEWNAKSQSFASGQKPGMDGGYKIVATEDWITKFAKSTWEDFNDNQHSLQNTFTPSMNYGGGWIKKVNSEILNRDLANEVKTLLEAYEKLKKTTLDTLEKELSAEILVAYKNANNSSLGQSDPYYTVNYIVNKFAEVCHVIAPEHTKRLKAILPALEAKKANITKKYNDFEKAVRERLIKSMQHNQGRWDSWVTAQNIVKINYGQVMNDIESWKGKNIMFRNQDTCFGLPMIDGNSYSMDWAKGIFDARNALHKQQTDYMAKLNVAEGFDPLTIAAHRVSCFQETNEQAIMESVGTITGIATLTSDNWITLPGGQRVVHGTKTEKSLQVSMKGFKWTDAIATPQGNSYTGLKIDDLMN